MIKGKCIKCDGNIVTLLLDAGNIAIGKLYKLIDVSLGTLAQNSTFHDLIHLFYDWMLKNDMFIIEDDGIIYDRKCSEPEELKGKIKQKWGKGSECYYYADLNKKGEPILVKAVTFNDIPLYARDNFIQGNKQRIIAKLFSWADYTLSNRKQTISYLITIMDRFGVDTPKYLDMRK